jgi:hypothetical protein
MTRQDRKKVSVFVVLLVVLAFTIVMGYRMSQPVAAGQAPEQPTTKPPVNPPAAGDASIRLDLVEKPGAAAEDIGKKDVFRYGQAPPPSSAVSRSGPPQMASSQPGAGPGVPPAIQTRPQGPPPPAPPPPIPLKYQGFATENKAGGGGFTAFLVDDSRHYNVNVGEVLMGRYRILAISDKGVDVEDLQYNRRQTLPLLK